MVKQYFKFECSCVIFIHIVFLMSSSCKCMNLPEVPWYDNPCEVNEINNEYVSHPITQHNNFNIYIQSIIEDNVPPLYFETYCPNVQNMLKILRNQPKKRTLYHMLLKWAYLIDIILRVENLKEYDQLLPYEDIKMHLKRVLCEYKSSYSFKNIKRVQEFGKCLPREPDRTAITSLDLQIRYSLPLFLTESLQILEHINS